MYLLQYVSTLFQATFHGISIKCTTDSYDERYRVGTGVKVTFVSKNITPTKGAKSNCNYVSIWVYEVLLTKAQCFSRHKVSVIHVK